MRPEKLWDKMAGKWDKPGVTLGDNDIRLTVKAGKYITNGSTVMDYGCATGSVAFEFARTAKKVYGVDISSKMIEKAAAKASDNKTGNITFIHGSIFNEGLKPESFDVITAFSILHLVEDLPQVLGRIRQLLKPGGMFISATPCMGQNRLVGGLMWVPVFLFSKTGAIPRVNFFTHARLTSAIAKNGLSVLESNGLDSKAISEFYLAAKKG
jgi:2-polyprenyl-3-methyl-5-hydroxy-6-metoxy-1,4-benzoquinol methylase